MYIVYDRAHTTAKFLKYNLYRILLNLNVGTSVMHVVVELWRVCFLENVKFLLFNLW